MQHGGPNIRRGFGGSPWILKPSPNPSAVLRLFCIPYAGGDTWVFHDWQRALPNYIEVCPIRLPGRGSRIGDKPFIFIDELVAALGEGLNEALDLPFAIYGHSMGALIGFELARHLRQTSGRRPVMLCVGACRAPQNASFRPAISNLGPHRLLEVLRRRYGASMEDLARNEELMRLTMPIMRADLSLCESYDYVEADPLDCPVVAYRGTADATLDAAAMDAWDVQTSDIFRHHEINGDHFFPLGSKNALLQVLSEDLAWSIS